MSTTVKGVFMGADQIKYPSNTFRLQEFYVDCTFVNQFQDRFENFLRMQANNDNVNLLAGLQKGDRIEVEYNIKGRFSFDKDGKKFHNQNLIIKSLKKIESPAYQSPAQQPTQQQAQPTQQAQPQQQQQQAQDEDDDLPF